MRGSRLKYTLACCAVTALTSHARADINVTRAAVGGNIIADASSTIVKCFGTVDVDTTLNAYQIDFRGGTVSDTPVPFSINSTSPNCLIVAQKTNDNDNCHDEGDMVFIDVEFGGLPASVRIGGGSFRIEYDPSCLDIVSVEGSPKFECDPTNGVADCPVGYTDCTVPSGTDMGICTPLEPWSNVIFSGADEADGVVFVVVGVPTGLAQAGFKGTNLAGTMAQLKFNKIGTCNDCVACLTSLNPQYTRLTDITGEEISCAGLGCTENIYDAGEITINCPGDYEVNADCDTTTADISWPTVSASGSCEASLDVSCSCVHEPPYVCSLNKAPCTPLEIVQNSCGPMGLGHCGPEFDPVDCDSLAGTGGTFPQGRYSFECAVDDPDTTCSGDANCSWTVMVSDRTTLDVVVQLSPNVKNTAIDRCLCFELYSSCSPEKFVEVCETMTFGPPWNFAGHASGSIEVPKGANYECITARDREHSLRATSSIDCDGRDYLTVFKGDPFFGGNWLTQGNLNGDSLIDILDFGIFLGQLNQFSGGPNTRCEDNDGQGYTHGDINGDGIVDIADFTFIQINFLDSDKNSCCSDAGVATALVPDGYGTSGPTSITVEELRRRDWDELIAADLNNDSVLDTADMAAYLQGDRPKPKPTEGKPNRNASHRPTRARR